MKQKIMMLLLVILGLMFLTMEVEAQPVTGLVR